jgi:GH15 family glucan-1,4-alpha-glucosidase
MADPEIRDLAAVGDGRTVALIGRDGTVEWLPLPSLDAPSVFASLLDRERGGSFRLAPIDPFDVRRRYLPGTNVLETTFVTPSGVATLTDAMTMSIGGGLVPNRELVRVVAGVSGSVPFRWFVDPRFGYGMRPTTIGTRSGVPVATGGDGALAISCWSAGPPNVGATDVSGSFTTSTGSSSIIALTYASQEPLIFPTRADVQRRLARTVAAWQTWVSRLHLEGPWPEALERSALALKLLIQSPTGAVAAAATTSLPERIGGERNWDYRFCWTRDAAFVMGALLALGCDAEAEAYFWWLMHASQLTHPRLQVLYRLDGGSRAREEILPLNGYRGSRPVRIGNHAVDQLQLDIYGDVLQTAWLYAGAGRSIDREIGTRLAAIADLVCDVWQQPDAGIWEVRSEPLQFTHSKMMCWVALDRAARLSEGGHVPSAHAERWRAAGERIRDFIEQRCWSDSTRSYTRSEGSDDLDASVLLGIVFGYGDPMSFRHEQTVDAIRRELASGPFLFRYRAEDGLGGDEGAFLCCSFWLAHALAATGRREESEGLLGRLVALSNDVGLYAEEIDAATSAFLGNVPQALTHLALINATMALRAGGAA